MNASQVITYKNRQDGGREFLNWDLHVQVQNCLFHLQSQTQLQNCLFHLQSQTQLKSMVRFRLWVLEIIMNYIFFSVSHHFKKRNGHEILFHWNPPKIYKMSSASTIQSEWSKISMTDTCGNRSRSLFQCRTVSVDNIVWSGFICRRFALRRNSTGNQIWWDIKYFYKRSALINCEIITI